jgi:hypothetical protein
MLRISLVAAAALLLAACGGSVAPGDPPSTSGTGGTSGSGGATTSSGSPAEECGTNGPCAQGSYCLYADHACGTTPAGVCPAAYCAEPASCDGIDGPPACGCDGKIYDNTCLAGAAGAGTSKLGTCGPPPQGRFACGHVFCEKGAQFCVVTQGDGCAFVDYQCRALPCGDPDCGCIDLSSECLGVACSVSADGDVTVECSSL